MASHGAASARPRSRADTALGVAVLAVALFAVAVAVAQDDNEWLWPLSGVVGAIGAVLGWQAGRPRPQGRALLAVVLGGLVFLVIASWVVWALATGNM